MGECSFEDFGSVDDFFFLSSKLYKSADELSLDDRMKLLPVLKSLVIKYNDTTPKNVVKFISRFIDDEILPYQDMYFKELQYKACLQDDDDDFMDDEDGEGSMHDELFLPMRKGSPLRFDGMSVLTEKSEEDDVQSMAETEDDCSVLDQTFYSESISTEKVAIPELLHDEVITKDKNKKSKRMSAVRRIITGFRSSLRHVFS